MTATATRSSSCRTCGDRIDPGDRIDHEPGVGLSHVTCTTAFTAPRPACPDCGMQTPLTERGLCRDCTQDNEP